MTAAQLFAAISRHFRRRRMARFVAELGVSSETRVLDIGGTPDNWRLLNSPPRLVLLNTPRAAADLAGASAWVAGDGCALPFRDAAFDVVFSNSVIEHVGDAASQRHFAREVVRVGRAYWVETPNRWFPVEQHLFTPFLHWLPQRWQRALVPRFNWWRVLVPLSVDRRDFYIDHYLRDVRLLGPRELRALFPEARILRERVLGVAKSLVALRRAGQCPAPTNPL
ncbi:MAG: methyltransferase domain-containing protein [Bryobacteraceae bacterium]